MERGFESSSVTMESKSVFGGTVDDLVAEFVFVVGLTGKLKRQKVARAGDALD